MSGKSTQKVKEHGPRACRDRPVLLATGTWPSGLKQPQEVVLWVPEATPGPGSQGMKGGISTRPELTV